MLGLKLNHVSKRGHRCSVLPPWQEIEILKPFLISIHGPNGKTILWGHFNLPKINRGIAARYKHEHCVRSWWNCWQTMEKLDVNYVIHIQTRDPKPWISSSLTPQVFGHSEHLAFKIMSQLVRSQDTRWPWSRGLSYWNFSCTKLTGHGWGGLYFWWLIQVHAIKMFNDNELLTHHLPSRTVRTRFWSGAARGDQECQAMRTKEGLGGHTDTLGKTSTRKQQQRCLDYIGI